MSAERFGPVRAAALAAVVSFARVASAQTEVVPETETEAGGAHVAFGADDVRLDAHSQSLDVSGNVRVDEPPFHLTSPALKLRRVPIGVELEGQGKLAFCPCLGTPLAVRFTGATVAPPNDVILRNPVLEVFGVPIGWAPVVWLRSPARFGLLPPDLAWRGADGFFAGGGVHVPWRPGDASRGIDLRAGGYVQGGVAVSAALATTSTSTRLTWDRFRGADGLTIDARGATALPDRSDAPGAPAVAWDVDAMRGARAVRATPDVEAAARPFDRGEAEATWRSSSWTVASGFRAVAPRGGDLLELGAAGPVVVLRRGDALAKVGTYDVTLEGGQVAGAGFGATSFARVEGGALLATRAGAFGAALAVRGLGDVADDAGRPGTDGAAQARFTFGLPLARAFASSEPRDPWVHTTEPYASLAVIGSHSDAVLAVPAGRGATAPSGGAWVAAAGWANAIARWGSRAASEIDATVGAVGDGDRALPALRARATVTGAWLSMRADFARVVAPVDQGGGALVAQARVGAVQGLHLTARIAGRDGVDPLFARALVDPTIEPASGFLASAGWTGAARVGLPLGDRITVRGGADVDLDRGELVAAVGSIELHDPCQCVVVRAHGSERIGRDGIDVWISVDLPMAGR